MSEPANSKAHDEVAILTLPGPAGKAVNRLLPLIKAGVLIVSVAAAIPTAQNLYYSWTHGIPFNEVSHRLTQYDLWMKNSRVQDRVSRVVDGQRQQGRRRRVPEDG